MPINLSLFINSLEFKKMKSAKNGKLIQPPETKKATLGNQGMAY
ncbi:hypothetical protein [Marinomonas pollencensis]|nr:hypothetical protein [Marinomonas pollencensis]